MIQRSILSLTLIILCVSNLVAQNTISSPKTGESIMTMVHQQSHVHLTQKASVSMVLYDEKKRKRDRSFNIWKKH